MRIPAGRRRTSALLLGALVASLIGVVPADAGTTYHEEATGHIDYPRGIDVAPDGRVLVADGGGWISEFDASGSFLRVLAKVPGAYGVAVDPDGTVFAAGSTQRGRSTVVRLDDAGNTVWSASVDGSLALTVVPGSVWVAGADRLSAVSTTDGSALPPIVLPSNRDGNDLTSLPNGNLLMANYWSGATEYTTGGTVVREIDDFNYSVAASDDGDLVGIGAHQVDGIVAGGLHVVRSDGQVFAAPGLDFTDLAVAPDGAVWFTQPDPAGDYQARLARLDPATADARISTPDEVVGTGDEVELSAASSTVPFSRITGYAWDLDGDGTFEHDTGTTPTTSTSYATRGTRSVTVRVTVLGGGTAMATVPVDVRATSPEGAVGVSIESGAQYTNDDVVDVRVRWPRFATSMTISNDGGFTRVSRRDVEPTTRWRLDSSGPERLPKTIYVRFEGGESGKETYQDDIILDQTRPTISSASTSTSSAASSRSLGAPDRSATVLARTRTITVKVRASDRNSGVGSMQVTQNRSRPGSWRAYRSTTRQKVTSGPVYVRVRDRAGNVSGWKRAR